jgi:hypothetical protein
MKKTSAFGEIRPGQPIIAIKAASDRFSELSTALISAEIRNQNVEVELCNHLKNNNLQA